MLNSILPMVEKFDLSSLLTVAFLLGSIISGLWLLIIKKRKRNAEDEEEAYQRQLASEYREAWLKSQEQNQE